MGVASDYETPTRRLRGAEIWQLKIARQETATRRSQEGLGGQR